MRYAKKGDKVRIQKHHLTAILLMGMIVSPIQFAAGASYKDAPKLEPFALTQEVINELTQIDPNVTKGSSFRLRGITVTADKPKWNRITLSVEVDPRLNLWRGRPNDLASSHLGSMNLIVTSITDENGKNIHDTSSDRPWSNKITIYNRGKVVFSGSRSATFKEASESVNIRQVSGKIQLSLPVNLKKYVVKADAPESTMPLLKRDEISKVELKNGIYIKHPKSTPDFRVTIMGFNSEGERISIASEGSAGSKRENHWYYFSNDTTFDKMIIFIPEKFIDLEIPFSIDVQNE